MAKKCKVATLNEVLTYFIDEIDGTGKNDGHERNLGLPEILKLCKEWKICELTEDEFWRLIIPDEFKLMLRDKRIEDVTGDESIETMLRYAKRLEIGESLPPLIVRNCLPHDTSGASYYIEDGAHKALGYKIYFHSNDYFPVMAYIGKRI